MHLLDCFVKAIDTQIPPPGHPAASMRLFVELSRALPISANGTIRLTVLAKYALQIMLSLRLVCLVAKLPEQLRKSNKVVSAKPRPAIRNDLEGVSRREARPVSRHCAYAAVVVLVPDAISMSAAPLIDQDEGASL